MKKMVALVAGGTGLVGGELISLLLEDERFEKVKMLSRREVNNEHPKLELLRCDFEGLEALQEQLSADITFCCLGTTIAKAGSKSAFRKVDEQYVLKLAELAKAEGSKTFAVVSAMGADPKSYVFYNKIKGQVEEKLKSLGMERLLIFQPSLLLGERDDYRTGEEFAKSITGIFTPLMVGPLRKYRPIQSRAVATAMIKAATTAEEELRIYQSDEIQALAD